MDLLSSARMSSDPSEHLVAIHPRPAEVLKDPSVQDAAVDAQLYQGMGGRKETKAFKRLYGMSPGDR